MYCKKCGTVIPAGSTKCENCGWEVPQNNPNEASSSTEESSLTAPLQEQRKTVKVKLSVWCWLAIASLCCSLVTLYEGFDKMFNYNSGDAYPHKYVNAYVGGDAYNFIINGTYATAYFVLTAMFVLAAIGLVIIHYLSQKERS